MHDYMVLQSQTVNVDLERTTTGSMKEIWKGPWEEIKKLTKTSKIYGSTFIMGLKRPTLLESKWKWTHTPPEPLEGANRTWVIENLNIRQGVGESGFLEVTYSIGVPQYQSDPDDPEKPDSGLPKLSADSTSLSSEQLLDGYKKTQSTTWQLTWQEDRRSVLDYSESPQEIVLYKEYPSGEAYGYYSDSQKSSTGQITSDKQKRIAEYYVRGQQALFHYPVVTLTEEYELPDLIGLGRLPTIGAELNKIATSLPGGCPFTLGGWELLAIGDVCSTRSTNVEKFSVKQMGSEERGVQELAMTTMTRTRTWQGAKHWDRNFYGDDAWEPVRLDGGSTDGGGGSSGGGSL